jgi:hypothetical protein
MTTDFPDWLRVREQDVLRCLLERGVMAPIDNPQDFFRHAHVIIWAEALKAREQGLWPDYLQIRQQLAQTNQLDTVGATYLHELSRDSVVSSAGSLESAAKQIKDAAHTRRWRAVLTHHASAERIDADRLTADIDALRHTGPEKSPLLDDVAVLTLPEPAYLVEGRVPARALGTLFGDPGVGKTFTTLDLGLSVASGRSWLGAEIVKRGPVVYIAAEGAPAPRIRGWKLTHGFDLDTSLGLHTWPGAVQLLEPAAVSKFIAESKPLKPVLVFIDTLSRCTVGGDENSARDMGLAVESMERIRTQLDATVINVHHTNKAGTSERGSGALRGASDFVLHLQHADDLLQLTCAKQKDAEVFEPINLKLVAAYSGAKTCVVRLTSEVGTEDTLSDAQGKALHALTELFGSRGATSTEWAEVTAFLSRATFYRARQVLVDRGYVRHESTRFYPTDKCPVSRRLMASLTETSHASQAVA